jgi:hypothetical protein
MMKILSLHVQANNGVSKNMGIVYVAPVISIEFYSTEAPFARTIIINNYFYYYDNALRGLINSP